MHLLIWTITLLCFVVSVTAMTRRKGLVGRKLKKSKVLVSPSDDRPVVKPYLPPQMDNEERMPESRKRKASLSVDRDKVESSKEVIGYEGRRLAIGIYFLDTLDAPPEEEWDGVDGTVAIIHRNFPHSTVYFLRIASITSQVSDLKKWRCFPLPVSGRSRTSFHWLLTRRTFLVLVLPQ
jgi:hypothetical protein